MNEREHIANRLRTIAGEAAVDEETVEPDAWRVAVRLPKGKMVELSYFPLMEEDDWSTGEHRVIWRPSARPYRVDSPRFSRGKTFTHYASAKKTVLGEAAALCLG